MRSGLLLSVPSQHSALPALVEDYLCNTEQEEQPLCQNVVTFGVKRQQDEDKGLWDSAKEPRKTVGGMSPVSPFKVFHAHNSNGISQGATQQLPRAKCETQGFKPRLCRVSLLVTSAFSSALLSLCLYNTLFVTKSMQCLYDTFL